MRIWLPDETLDCSDQTSTLSVQPAALWAFGKESPREWAKLESRRCDSTCRRFLSAELQLDLIESMLFLIDFGDMALAATVLGASVFICDSFDESMTIGTKLS